MPLKFRIYICSSWLLLFSHSVVSNSLQPHGLQHTRLPCPSSSHVQAHVHWVCPTISSSVIPFSSCLQLFPASSGSNPKSLFQWVGSLHQWLKYWRFSFNISPSSAYSGLISFRIDWFDLLAVQGTLKSLLQHHNSEASILRHSAVLWSYSYIRTWLLEKP